MHVHEDIVPDNNPAAYKQKISVLEAKMAKERDDVIKEQYRQEILVLQWGGEDPGSLMEMLGKDRDYVINRPHNKVLISTIDPKAGDVNPDGGEVYNSTIKVEPKTRQVGYYSAGH